MACSPYGCWSSLACAPTFIPSSAGVHFCGRKACFRIYPRKADTTAAENPEYACESLSYRRVAGNEKCYDSSICAYFLYSIGHGAFKRYIRPGGDLFFVSSPSRKYSARNGESCDLERSRRLVIR